MDDLEVAIFQESSTAPRHAAGYVSLLSAFPTKLKLRFFKSDPQQLAEVDPLLRQVLPLTKKVGPVHSLDTAKAQG